MESEQKNETAALVTGLGLVGLALFCGLSLYSHSVADEMGYEAGTGQVLNLGGLLGAKIAHHLNSIYGVASWVITFFLLVFGGVMCTARSMSGMLSRGVGAILVTAVVCTWAGTLTVTKTGVLASSFTTNYPAGLGGLLGGRYLGQPLVSYFGGVGVYLVLVTAGLLAGLLVAQHLTEYALAMVGRGVVQAGSSFVLLLGGLKRDIKKQMAGLIPVGADTNTQSGVAEGQAIGSLELRGRTKEADEDLFEQPPTKKVRVKSRAVVAEVEEEDEEWAEETQEAKAPKRNTTKAKSNKKASVAAEPKKDKAAQEAELMQQRREEAVRQAEVAEKNRLDREREEREKLEKDAKALAKLEKEKAIKDKAHDKAQKKFMAAMSPKEREQVVAAAAAEKPQLPDEYVLPKLDKLHEKDKCAEVSSDSLKERGAKLIETLWEFKIGSRLINITHGPAVTMFELSLDPGIKVSKVVGLADNLAMAMRSEHGVRIIAPLPGRDTIGIEIPNTDDYVVRIRPVLESTAFRTGSWTLPLVLGRDATGNPLVADLARMPHLLIAGTTGSGKSVCVNAIILSLMLLRRPHDVKLILVDPKQVEMTDFKGIPHLLAPVVTDMKMAAGVFNWAVEKMEARYRRMGKVGVRNIDSFNKMSREDRLARIPKDECPDDYIDPMPYIVIIVDEFADLMMTSGKEIEQSIARLAQKARAAGLHVILATQRPSNDVVTGLIKTNLPCRISFQVKSKIDSRIVLDTSGAEKLAGKGDLLFIPPGTSHLLRAKGVFVDDGEIRDVVDSCKKQASPVYSDEIEKAAVGSDEENNFESLPLDERFDDAVECFLAMGRASTSLLQRRLSVGYTRAAKLCDQMEIRGIVGPDRGAKGRELLITDASWEQYKQNKIRDVDPTWGKLGSKDNPLASDEDEMEEDEAVDVEAESVEEDEQDDDTPEEGEGEEEEGEGEGEDGEEEGAEEEEE